jgi:hypothetical protein
MSQEELACRCGPTRTYISLLERGLCGELLDGLPSQSARPEPSSLSHPPPIGREVADATLGPLNGPAANRRSDRPCRRASRVAPACGPRHGSDAIAMWPGQCVISSPGSFLTVRPVTSVTTECPERVRRRGPPEKGPCPSRVPERPFAEAEQSEAPARLFRGLAAPPRPPGAPYSKGAESPVKGRRTGFASWVGHLAQDYRARQLCPSGARA